MVTKSDLFASLPAEWPADSASRRNSANSSGSSAMPIPRFTRTARSPLLGRSNKPIPAPRTRARNHGIQKTRGMAAPVDDRRPDCPGQQEATRCQAQADPPGSE